jgi:hypothetical protein
LNPGSFLKNVFRSGFLVTSTAAAAGNPCVAEAIAEVVRVFVGAEAEAGCERFALGIGGSFPV